MTKIALAIVVVLALAGWRWAFVDASSFGLLLVGEQQASQCRLSACSTWSEVELAVLTSRVHQMGVQAGANQCQKDT